MLEKTVAPKIPIRARRSDPTGPYCVNRNFSRYWLIRTARNPKIRHYAKKPTPSNLINTQGAKSNTQAKIRTRNKNSQNNTLHEILYQIYMFNANENNNDIERLNNSM